MKKVLSILLILVFLFNVGGYYILFWSLRFETDRQFSYRLDTNRYDRQKTVELKIPVALPYPIQTTGYQRVDGTFEHNGEFFKLIKHKLQGDTLYVVCIRDEATRELVEAMTDYIKLTQAIPGSDTSHKALNYLTKLLKDYYGQPGVTINEQTGLNMPFVFAQLSEDLLRRAIPVLAPPPKI